MVTAPVTGRGAGTGETGAIVYTVNYPLAYFAGRIGGDHVNVNFPAPAGADPAEWSPASEAISRYQQADLVLLNGAGYAAWTARATLPAGKLVDTSAAFRDDYLYIEDAPTHTHGPSGDHTHRNLAATTWLDPVLAIEQARAVRDAFVKTWPRFEAEFDAGFKSVAADLKALDGEFGALFEQEGDQPLLFSHPVYEYFVRRFELDARFLHWEPDQPLTDADLDELAEILSTHAANLMIWEREPLPATRETLDRLGVASVVFETGAATPAEGDYLALMRRNLDRLKGAL